jgi:integrase
MEAKKGRRTHAELKADGDQPRNRGEGSIFRITTPAGKRWRATFTYEMRDGVALQVAGTGVSKEQAIARRDANYRKRLVIDGQLPASNLKQQPVNLKKTVEEMLEEWISVKETKQNAERIATNVAFRYRGLIKNHINPHIGERSLRLITKEDLVKLLYVTLPAKRKTLIQDFNGQSLKVVTEEPLLGTTPLRTIQAILNMAFRYALENKLILENPTIGIDKRLKPEAIEEHLEKKHWIPRQLIANLEEQDNLARWILVFYGLRQSERLGLEWSDIVLNPKKDRAGTINIHQQLIRNEGDGRLYLGKPKTRAGNRIIPIDDRVREILRSYKKKQDSWKKSPNWEPVKGLENLVFTTEKGKPIRHTTDNKQWHILLRQEGLKTLKGEARKPIPYIRQHAMRHIAISLMIEAGAPMEIVRNYAGHGDEKITRSVYLHLSSKPAEIHVQQLTDNIFSKNNSGSDLA